MRAKEKKKEVTRQSFERRNCRLIAKCRNSRETANCLTLLLGIFGYRCGGRGSGCREGVAFLVPLRYLAYTIILPSCLYYQRTRQTLSTKLSHWRHSKCQGDILFYYIRWISSCSNDWCQPVNWNDLSECYHRHFISRIKCHTNVGNTMKSSKVMVKSVSGSFTFHIYLAYWRCECKLCLMKHEKWSEKFNENRTITNFKSITQNKHREDDIRVKMWLERAHMRCRICCKQTETESKGKEYRRREHTHKNKIVLATSNPNSNPTSSMLVYGFSFQTSI